MSQLNEKTGICFVYDGACPVCTHAAFAMRIKKKYGSITTIDARTSPQHPLLQEINKRGLDLDEGMVVYCNGQFYHGKDVLKFMAKHGEARNFIMSGFKALFWSDTLARLSYPWMRACRNWLLRRQHIGRIDNLKLAEEPIFKSIFGKDWDSLPPVMKKHYANHPYTTEVTRVEGSLDVYCKPPLLWLSPLMTLAGLVPAFNENNVPVTVCFESDVNSTAFHFNRRFRFSGRKPYIFRSRMLQINDNQVVEIMRFGFSWKMNYFWDGEKVVLEHAGYALQIFGHLLPLPLTFLLGAGNAVEYPLDETNFDMEVNITHPWLGKIYGYKGRFQVSR